MRRASFFVVEQRIDYHYAIFVTATLCRDSWSTGLYFAVYHVSKRKLNDWGLFDSSTLTNLAAGGLCGSLTWAVATPADVVKTRVQGDLRGQLTMLGAVRSVWTNEGARAFLKGLGPCAIRGGLVNAVTFCVYEEVWRWIRIFEANG